MKGTRRRITAGAACTLLAFVSAAGDPGYSEERKGEIIDRIVAVVEDRAVLQSELELELRRYMLQENRTTISDEEADKMRQEVLDGLVADLLMTVHAEKEGIEIQDGEVDSEVQRAIDENKRAIGGDEAFERQLEREGMTLQQLRSIYREKLKARMLIQRLMYREIVSEAQVTEGEVKKYYRENIDELPMRPATVNIAHILLVPEASSGARESALERVREIEAKVKEGMDFAALARDLSEGPSAKYGGSLGYVRLEDLNNPAFENAVRELKIGETSAPVLTEFGYHIIKLEDVSGDRVMVRHILVRVESGEDDVAATAELAETVRKELLAGSDFGEMASRYSDDHATKETGGVVGEIPLESLPEFFREVIEDVEVGEIAPVIKEKKGFRIVKILERTQERPFTFEEAREELMRRIEQQRLKEKFQDYVDGLKKIYYVEVKGDL